MKRLLIYTRIKHYNYKQNKFREICVEIPKKTQTKREVTLRDGTQYFIREIVGNNLLQINIINIIT